MVRWFSIGFIELWRGSPLLAVLFMGLIMLPMFLPDGMTVDNLIRAIVVMTLFEVRLHGGDGARRAAGRADRADRGGAGARHAQGRRRRSWWCCRRRCGCRFPGIINIVVDLFKDTTLVSIVGLFDLMGVINQSLKDPNWLGLAMEGYTFAMVTVLRGLPGDLACRADARAAVRQRRADAAAVSERFRDDHRIHRHDPSIGMPRRSIRPGRRCWIAATSATSPRRRRRRRSIACWWGISPTGPTVSCLPRPRRRIPSGWASCSRIGPGFVAPTLAARKFATLDQITGGRAAIHVISGGDDADQ